MRGLFILSVLVVATALLAQDKDILILRRPDGATKRQPVDQIGDETYEKIKYRMGTVWSEEEAENVVDVIRRVDASREFLDAEEKREKANFSAAKRLYERVINKKRSMNRWEKIYAAFYRAYCTYMLGLSKPSMLKEALKYYEDFISTNPRHRLTPRAIRDKGIIQILTDDLAGAGGTFRRLSRGDYGRYWTVVGKFWVGEVAYRQGNTAEAKRQWRDAKADAPQYALEHIPAKYELLLAEEAFKAGNIDTAINRFKRVIRYDPQKMEHPIGSEIMAKAHNGLGDCYLRKGANEKDILLAALVEYIKTRDIYTGGGVKEVKRALKGAIEVCKRLEALETNTDRKNEFVSMRATFQSELAKMK